MKNFKFKLNFLFNLLKKNKVLKKTNIFLDNTKKLIKLENIKKKYLEIYNKFYKKNLKLNYLIFFLSIFFFLLFNLFVFSWYIT